MEGRWKFYVCVDCGESAHGPGSRCAKDRRRTWTQMAEVPVVPCDDEAVDRVARELCHQRGWKWEDETTPQDILLTSARKVLRAAGGAP
jgi:hypothetical protein